MVCLEEAALNSILKPVIGSSSMVPEVLMVATEVLTAQCSTPECANKALQPASV